LQIVRITSDPLTNEEKIEEEDIVKPPNFGKKGGPPPKTFDVSKRGEYLGMPRIEDHVHQMYEEFGVDDPSKLRLDQR